ncbi:hypothetical protein ASPCADRAFT_126624 [Aspergillus carbonarius ITEM 5010]|uniref:Uncharacterized protein n=1 Tax=Aspergillus carbonarius (strain ITEM 5010) TaxID=602072 RepID=A0A1R3RZ14_ASPC5|nr:hypothetical protein ASPCADRAFT_126624 [Aspergillus carbonarius ITEM 5010]
MKASHTMQVTSDTASRRTYIRRVTAKENLWAQADQDQPTSKPQAHVEMVERDKPNAGLVTEKIQRSGGFHRRSEVEAAVPALEAGIFRSRTSAAGQ